MTKIQITQEQAEAIEVLKTNLEHNSWDYIAQRLHTNDKFIHEYKPFNGMTLEKIVKAVYEGYELLNPIFAGSYVRSKSSGNIYKVKFIHSNKKYADLEGILCMADKSFSSVLGLDSLELISKEELQEAKEKRFWEKLDREVNEFRKGDTVKYGGMTKPYTLQNNHDIRATKYDYEQGTLKGFFPAESFVSFEELE